MSVDIVNLIESNPITKFSGDYQNKLIEKIKNHFTNYEQQLFLSSFCCYLKYDNKKDFVIDLDNVWKWLGFSQKIRGKELLEKHFYINKDYKILLSLSGEQKNVPEASGAKKNVRGGHNKEIIMLNLDTFKKFCLKAGTKKADEVHDYFIKLENIMFEITKEKCDELKQQLQTIEDTKNKETEEKLLKQKELDNEMFLLKEYAMSGPLVYVIKVKTFENGTYVDTAAITKGKGWQGVIYRWGAKRKQHKSRKTVREIGSLGPISPQNVMYTVPRAGQTGFHQRIEYDKRIMIMSNTEKEEFRINPDGGFKHFGNVNGDFIVVKGSVPGTYRRLIKLRKQIRNEPKKVVKPNVLEVVI